MLDLRRALFRSGVTVGGMLRRLGLDGPRLDPDRLLARAEDLAGCDVWGEPEPRTPLSHLVQDLEREAGLHLPGKIAARFDLLRMLTHRLRIEAAFVRDPGLLAAPITRPLFVVGMPRSGTTALHGLLARDPSRRAPSTWEVLYPIPRKAPTSADANRRRARVARQLPWMDAMSPGFQRGHALEAGEPQECVNITAHSMESFQFQSMYRVPGYQAWLEPRSGVARYRYHRRFLQYLQRFDETPRRWVLKAPAHLFDLGALLEVYPDAAIVQTHREPFEVVSSLASLTVNLRSAFSDAVDPFAAGRELMDRWAGALQNSLDFRDRLPDQSNFHDLRYADFMADTTGAIEGIYRYFDLPWSDEFARRLRIYLDERPQHRFGVHRHRLEDFGIAPDEVDARLAAYRDRFLGGAR